MSANDWVKKAILPVAAWVDAWLCVATNQFVDPDLWGRLSIGALTFQNGRFPYRDVFSYTAPNARWVDHEWLTGFVFYQLVTRLGEPGLILLQAGILLGILALIFSIHRKLYQVSGLWAFYSSLVLAELYALGFQPAVRSHVFSFLFFVVFIAILERIRLNQLSSRWLWALACLIPLWGNLHGGVAMGFLLLGCYGAGKTLEEQALKAALPYGATIIGSVFLLGLLNPYGPDYLSFLFTAWTWDRSLIHEWDPLRIGSPLFIGQQALVIGTGLLLLLNWLFRDKSQPESQNRLITPTLVLVLLMAMTLKSMRIQTFLAFGLLIYAPLFLTRDFFRRIWPPLGSLQIKRGILISCIIPGILTLGAIGGLAFISQQRNLLTVPMEDELGQGSNGFRYPVAALQYLKQSSYRGNLLVRFGLGEFAYWQLYPRFKVSMDGRYEEVYTQAQFLTNDAFFNREHPEQTIQAASQIHKTKADFILIEANMPNLAALEKSDQWQLLYGDNHFRLFGRAGLEPYVPARPIITDKILTIQDFIQPDTLKRFRF